MIARLLYLFIVSLVVCSCSNKENQNKISIEGRRILLNGSPYYIRGVCYHPVPKGKTQRSFDNLPADIELMKEAGVNTVRFYSPVDDVEVLNAFHQSGIHVIMGFGYNQDGFYDILSGTFIDYIHRYKGHPAILFWELGNEYNYHPEWFGGDLKNWYSALNSAARKAHEADSLHPVATAHGELPDSLALSMCPDVDIWGMNVYRWDNPGTIFRQWSEISSKPMYLSEAGGDSYMTIERNGYQQGVNEKAQADALTNILKSVFQHKNICSGVSVFSFTDGWWKAGNPGRQDPGGWAPTSSGVPYDGVPNEEYWGIVNIDRQKKLAFDVVKMFYAEKK